MKKTIIAILVFCTALLTFPTAPAQAQNSEVGACVGTTFYLGDLNPKKLFAQPHVAAGLVYRYNISPRWAIKADFMFGKVSASDSLTNNGYARNLSFSSPITEFSIVGELNFFQLYTSTGKNHFAPYIFAGVTVFSFNPMTEYNNETYELQSLGTEGQGLNDMPKKYSLTHFAIPSVSGSALISEDMSVWAPNGVSGTPSPIIWMMWAEHITTTSCCGNSAVTSSLTWQTGLPNLQVLMEIRSRCTKQANKEAIPPRTTSIRLPAPP